MTRVILLWLLVACERDPQRAPSPDPSPSPPGPRRLEPEPTPTPIERSLDRKPNARFFRITVDTIVVDGNHVLALTPATTSTEITAAVTRALPRSTNASDEILVDAKQDVAYTIIIAVMDGAKAAGYSRMTIGTGL